MFSIIVIIAISGVVPKLLIRGWCLSSIRFIGVEVSAVSSSGKRLRFSVDNDALALAMFFTLKSGRVSLVMRRFPCDFPFNSKRLLAIVVVMPLCEGLCENRLSKGRALEGGASTF